MIDTFRTTLFIAALAVAAALLVAAHGAQTQHNARHSGVISAAL
jgi:hypothetical protein